MAERKYRIERRQPEDHGQLPEVADPYLRRILMARGLENSGELDLSLSSLLHYRTMKGIRESSEIIARAMEDGRRIVVVGDYDVDGATATALAVRVLRAFGCTSVDFFIPDREEMGYGLTVAAAETVREQKHAELIITVDNGITSFEGVARARELGMAVLITDHHLASGEIPEAEAVVNPNQPGCAFPSKFLAGVGVIFYVMIALRAYLRETGWFERRGIPVPRLASFLDLVAVGSIADVVRFDHNNRILISHGIGLIRSGAGCRCFPLIMRRSLKDPVLATESDVCHVIAPILNAAGRIESMDLGIRCLLADSNDEIEQLINELILVNTRRREMECLMREHAEQMLEDRDLEHMNSIVLYDPSYHQGIVGLVASRLKESFSRPAVVLAPAGNGELKGSARSVDGVNIKAVLEEMARERPELLVRFGGHAMAAGLTIREQQLQEFTQAFSGILARSQGSKDHCRVVLTDGQLPQDHLTLEFARSLKILGPWGGGFDCPLFDGEFVIRSFKYLSSSRHMSSSCHLRMSLCPSGSSYEYNSVMFNVPQDLVDGDLWHRLVRICYRLDLNNWRGNYYLQLVVEEMEIIS